MYCRNCGKEINPNADYCVSCGVSKGKGKSYCQSCGQPTSQEADVCVNCGALLGGVKSGKSKIAAGLLGIFVGGLGVHRFYLGYTTLGVIQIIVTILTCGAGSIWGLIEGILILAGTCITTDADGNQLID